MHEKDTSLCASTVSANLAIFEKLQGLWMARAIHVAGRLGLPDLLASRPKKLSELALATATDESILHRLLRCLKHLVSLRKRRSDATAARHSPSNCSATVLFIGWQCYMVRSGNCGQGNGWRIVPGLAFRECAKHSE